MMKGAMQKKNEKKQAVLRLRAVRSCIISTIETCVCVCVEYPLVNLTSSQLCEAGHVTAGSVEGKAVVVMRGGCDFSQKALVAQDLGASVLLIASMKNLVRV